MSVAQFKAILDRPTWSKDLVVWVGDREALDHVLVAFKQQELDLLDLLPDDEALPAAREDRAELLDRELDKRLQAAKPPGTERVILRVRNAAVLAKYGVGLQRFYEWFGGSHTLAVLEIDRLRPVTLPTGVASVLKLDTKWLAGYFRPMMAKPDRLFVEAA